MKSIIPTIMTTRDLGDFSDKWTQYCVVHATVTLTFEDPAAHIGRHGNDDSGTITFEGYVYLISEDGQYRAYVNSRYVAIGRMNSFGISTGGTIEKVRDEAFPNTSRWARDMADIVTLWEILLAELYPEL